MEKTLGGDRVLILVCVEVSVGGFIDEFFDQRYKGLNPCLCGS